jgi:hypothetical protein
LQLLAEKSEISFPTNPTVLKDILLRGDKANRIAPVRIRHEPLITPIEPYQHSKPPLTISLLNAHLCFSF